MLPGISIVEMQSWDGIQSLIIRNPAKPVKKEFVSPYQPKSREHRSRLAARKFQKPAQLMIFALPYCGKQMFYLARVKFELNIDRALRSES